MEWICYNIYIYVESYSYGGRAVFGYDPKPPVTKETMLIGLRIAYLIRDSRDEKEAIRRICRFLNHWEIPIAPGELGSARREP